MPAHMRRPHLDADSIAEAVEDYVVGPEGIQIPHHAAVAVTGVVDPANASYTQADQTALAHQFKALVTDHNLLITQLIAAGLMAAS